MSDSFVHLHVHTEYSMLDGAANIGAAFAAAGEDGQPAIAKTDHGNQFGDYEAWVASKAQTEAGKPVKAILGVEAYMAPASRFDKKPIFWGGGNKGGKDANGESGDVSGGGKYTHMTLLAQNAQGLRALYELGARSSKEGSYGKPRGDAELLAECIANWPGATIIGTTGCPGGEVQTRIRLGQYEKALEAAAKYRDILGPENFFLELMDHGLPVEKLTRDDLLRLAAELNIPLLATNDSHYVAAADAPVHDAMLCVQTGAKQHETDRFKFEGDQYYIKSAAEMRAQFSALPAACDNTLEIAERIAADAYDEVFDYQADLLPEFPVPEGHTEATWLREEVKLGLQKKYPDPAGPENIRTDAHERGLEYEVPVIVKSGYPGYMLVVADFVNWARDKGIRVGPGRGSAAGSIVSYAMGITTVPTLEHDLLFERFMNPERVSPPDVDIDFPERHQKDVFRYLEERWGQDRVCRIQTIGRIKAKAAIKDACRVLDMPFGLGAKMTATYPKPISGFDASLSCVTDAKHERYADAEEFRALLGKEDGAQQVYELALKLEGLIRSAGVHACGIVVSRKPLLGLIPMTWSEKEQQWVSGFPNAEALEPMGLLKVDVLAINNLDIIQSAVEGIQERYGVDVEPRLTELDDPAVFAQVATGRTVGMFQVASGGMAKLLAQMRADCFEDLSAAGALYRPGPMGAEAHTDYALRKTGRQVIKPIHPELEEALRDILGPTYGVIAYQEQVMAAAQAVAGYSLAKADLLRKAMGKKKPEVLAKEYVPFREGMAAQGFSEEATKALWDVFLPFSAYAFNRCVSGDTEITRLGRGSHDWPQTVENVANRLHGRPDFDGSGCQYCYNEAERSMASRATCTACKSWRDKWKKNGGMNAAGRVDDRILPVTIVDVFRQGVKATWKLTLENGVTATATGNHRHLTPAGWRQVDELVVGDDVSVMADAEWESTARTDTGGTNNWVAAHGYYVAERAHGKAGPFLHGRHADLKQKTALLEQVCLECGETEGRLERAHLDGDPMNNATENLAYLCNSCHKKHDYANGGRTKMWRKGREVVSSPITAIEYVGEQMTYDVTVDSDDHSWVANGGIVTHNSHTVSYAFIVYATAWLKTHYPAEYMAAVLTQEGDDADKKAMYLAECRRMGITVLVPDVNESGPSFTPIGDKTIRFGLNAISGLGSKAVPGIITGRAAGPYTSFNDFLDRIPLATCGTPAVGALIRGGAFDSLGHTRSSLTASFENGVKQLAGVKKKEATGQFDLFSATEEVALDSVGLRDIAEWDRELLLQLEREALGLYVSGHPLEDLESTLAGNRTMTIADLAAAISVDDEGMVADPSVTGAILAGQLVSVEHKIARSSQKPYAKMVLADLDGQIEIMAFGRSYGSYRHTLVPDAKVRIKVSLWDRDEGEVATVCTDTVEDLDMKLIGETDHPVSTGPRPVRVAVDPKSFGLELVTMLRKVVFDNPGARPLHFQVGAEPFVPDGWLVDPNVEFLTGVKELCGRDSVQL
jgi:DNA-directed DNA polymerase III PolC